MGIGLSNGAYYDDEHHYAAAKWDDKYDNNELDPEVNDLHTEDNNVQAPPSRVEKSTAPQPIAYVDPNDMTNQYNTKLTPEEQVDYNKKFSPGDSYDYDMQGWYKANPGADPKGEGVHYPDTFKKPNHPTFSDQSQYHSDDTPGGHWDQLEDQSYTFTPGATNLKYHDKDELNDYFKKVEPNNKLILDDKPKDMLSTIKGMLGMSDVSGSNNTETLAPNLSHYPNQEDAKLAIKSGMGYGTGNEPYINAERANVYKYPTQNSELGKVINEPLDNKDLTKFSDLDSLGKVNTAFAQAALAVNKDPIATLGFKPDKTNLQIKNKPTNLAGFTDPSTGRIWVNLQEENKSTITHESLHNGLRELRNTSPEAKDLIRQITSTIAYKIYSKYGDDKSEKAQNLLSSLPEEFIVRHIMQDKMGNPEEERTQKYDPDRKQIAAHQIDEAAEIFKDKDLQKKLTQLREIAADVIKEKNPHGPH